MKKIVYLIAAMFLLNAAPALANCGMCPLGAKGATTEEYVEKKMEKLTSELGLSEEQAGKVKGILTDKMEKKKAAKAEKREKMDAISAEFSDKVNAVLDDEQKVKFEAIKAEWKKGSTKGSGHDHKGSGSEHKGSGTEEKKGS